MLDYFSKPTTEEFKTSGIPEWLMHPVASTKDFAWYSTRGKVASIQKELIHAVYHKTNGKYNISEQSDTQLLSIMWGVYHEYRIFDSFEQFSAIVVEKALEIVLINIYDTLNYITHLDMNGATPYDKRWQNVLPNPQFMKSPGDKKEMIMYRY